MASAVPLGRIEPPVALVQSCFGGWLSTMLSEQIAGGGHHLRYAFASVAYESKRNLFRPAPVKITWSVVLFECVAEWNMRQNPARSRHIKKPH